MGRLSRRTFLQRVALLTAGASAAGQQALSSHSQMEAPDMFFKISLAEWSFHKSIKGGKMKNLDFPVRARREFDIDAVEYVNELFDNKATDADYLKELKGRCSDHGVKSLLIMCDGEGDLADRDSTLRRKAVENHYRWVDAAHFLGGHSVRVNCNGKGTPEEVAEAGADGLSRLCEYGRKVGMNVLVENHGGYSSDPLWLTGIIRSVNMKNCGALPDFDNFDLPDGAWYDRYKGVKELMPFAKAAVSAKTINFDATGNCMETDYLRMMKIVKDAGYRNYLGIEYEGDQLSEEEGIRATVRLLQRVAASLG